MLFLAYSVVLGEFNDQFHPIYSAQDFTQWAPAPSDHVEAKANGATTISRTQAEWKAIHTSGNEHGSGTQHIETPYFNSDNSVGHNPTELDVVGLTGSATEDGTSEWDTNTAERQADDGAYPTTTNCGTADSPVACQSCTGANATHDDVTIAHGVEGRCNGGDDWCKACFCVNGVYQEPRTNCTNWRDPSTCSAMVHPDDTCGDNHAGDQGNGGTDYDVDCNGVYTCDFPGPDGVMTITHGQDLDAEINNEPFCLYEHHCGVNRAKDDCSCGCRKSVDATIIALCQASMTP